MRYAENCIPEEELPTRAGLIVIRKNDPNYGLSDEEIQDRIESIRCFLLKDFEILLMIPKQDYSDDFFITEHFSFDDAYSAFNTVDFQRQLGQFNRYGYAMKKIMGRMKDLAIMHSCISNPEDRKAVYEKFKSNVGRIFGDQIEELAQELHFEDSSLGQAQIRRKIANLEQKLHECQKVWERYAPPENWDC